MGKLFKNLDNKKNFLSLGSLGVFLLIFSLFYPFPASAAVLDSLANLVRGLPFIFASFFLVLFIIITQAIAWLGGFFLDVVISPSFINLSYTNPASNQIIRAGLNITQNFVNLFLVIALVYAALSIALRINETEAKKMLVRLIIVALLANFAPVFCGLVVDATNIVMYYFLRPLDEGVSGVLTQVGTFIDTLVASLKKTFDLTEGMGLLMMGIAQIMLNVSVAVAFLFYAMIFLMRYIAIWILVILAPLAFVGWVFPSGGPGETWEFLDWILFPLRIFRGFWDKWLKQFTEWAIIGIPMAFFLYLAIGSFSIMTAAFRQEMKMTMPGAEEQTIGFFNNVLPYFVISAFLFLGFSLGLETGAMGAGRVVNAFRAAHKTAQKLTMQSLGRTTVRGAREVRRGARAVGREIRRVGFAYREERQKGSKVLKSAVKAPLTYAKRIPERIKTGFKSKIITPIKEGIDDIGIYYGARRTQGIPPKIAMMEAVGTFLHQKPVIPHQEDIKAMSQTLGGLLLGSKKGIVGTVRSVVEAGLKGAGIKIPQQKGFKTCPVCGNNEIAKSATFCPKCGYKFEEEKKEGKEEKPLIVPSTEGGFRRFRKKYPPGAFG